MFREWRAGGYEDDPGDFIAGHEGGEGAGEDGMAVEGGGELVETHAAAGSGGDDDDGNFNFQNSSFKEEDEPPRREVRQGRRFVI